ncbi:hypothetical protein OEA41_004175 [Lepraria neglecta]|uniref:Uncharacterized protein n=1 Tax=Lepraria neglecta TaxID=209136 RepID=A0AAE0DJW7_9LECA|nr:hypothetical protein OEA41_004175 [Lepraria neglecta]
MPSSSQPNTPRSLIYPHPLLHPPKTKYDLLPSSYPITALEASRAGLESAHIKEQSQIFSSSPFVLNDQTLSNLRQHPMSKQDAHRFCWKDCAVYVTVDLGDEFASTGVGVERVFNFLYRTWFRDGEAHLDVGHFFGRAVRCWEPGGLETIKEIVEAHRLVCERVREKQADEGADEDEVFEWNRRHGGFVLKRSFERFFVVVDRAGWWERGVLVVRSERAKEVEGGR